jgi:hypothetical protein
MAFMAAVYEPELAYTKKSGAGFIGRTAGAKRRLGAMRGF